MLGPDQDLHDVLSGIVEISAPQQALYDMMMLGLLWLLGLPIFASCHSVTSWARFAAWAPRSVRGFASFLGQMLGLLLPMCRLLLVAGSQHRILSGQHERLHQMLQAILDPVHYCFVIVVGIGLLTQAFSFE